MIEEKGYRNVIAKNARPREVELFMLMEKLSPTEALTVITDLILAHANKGQWDRILPPDSTFPIYWAGFKGLLPYWVFEVREITKDEIERGKKAYDLIELIKAKIGRDETFRSLVFNAIADFLLESITFAIPNAEAENLWDKFLALSLYGPTENQARPVGFSEMTLRGFTGLRAPHAWWFMQRLTPHKVMPNSLEEKILWQLWENLTGQQTHKQYHWAMVLQPLMEFQRAKGPDWYQKGAGPSVVEACATATKRICNFALALEELPELINKPDSPLQFLKVEADYTSCKIHLVEVWITPGHVRLRQTSIKSQEALIMDSRRALADELGKWRSRHDIQQFNLEVFGKMREPSPKSGQKEVPFKARPLAVI